MTGDAARGYLVFAQQREAAVDLGAWDAHARRFFGASLSRDDDGRLVLTPGGARTATARPRTGADLALADAAEARAGGGGLATLARRCPTVWLVAREGDDDAVALRLAAILASVLLGPIVDARGPDIFGVKTARAKLET